MSVNLNSTSEHLVELYSQNDGKKFQILGQYCTANNDLNRYQCGADISLKNQPISHRTTYVRLGGHLLPYNILGTISDRRLFN